MISQMAVAGSVHYSGTAVTGSCTMYNTYKNMVNVQNELVALYTKKISTLDSESSAAKDFGVKLKSAQDQLLNLKAQLKYEYSYSFPVNFIFQGDGVYALNYSKYSKFENLELQNFHVDINEPFFTWINDTDFSTQIPGAWNVSVSMSIGFVCEHPLNSDNATIHPDLIEKIAADFFMEQ